jgi:hypothetical protein
MFRESTLAKVSTNPGPMLAITGLAICGQGLPVRLSFDHDPLFRFQRWQAHLRILGVETLQTVHGELPFKRRLAVQTIRGNGFANGNPQGRLAEVLGRPLSPKAWRRIALGAREPRCTSV